MPEEGNRPYTWALTYAVVERETTFETGDAFADWFGRV
jgi:hypothetical protein